MGGHLVVNSNNGVALNRWEDKVRAAENLRDTRNLFLSMLSVRCLVDTPVEMAGGRMIHESGIQNQKSRLRCKFRNVSL